MKKFITMAIAAGALAVGGAASAQDLGSVAGTIISEILGFGQPTYSQPSVTGQVYADQFGRQFYYDQYGRQVYLNTTQQTIVGYDSWGRPIYGNSGQYAYNTAPMYGNSWDRDGDGVSNSRDRWPDDPRYR